MSDIPIARTNFTDEDRRNILKPLESGWIVQGPYVEEFEKKWSSFTGSNHSIAVSNCTNALIVSLAALDITGGDEVIVPSFTWIATANAVESIGATPIFCDISLDTFNIDINLVEDQITDRTKAIIPVHLFGLPVAMDELMAIANKHNLMVIEDAACGFSSFYKGTHVGNFGQTGCFSFHPRKALTTGEGGMVTTGDDRLADKIRAMRNHGAELTDHQRHNGAKPYELPEFPYMGYNFRMTDIQGAIGTSQMDRADEIAAARRIIASKYDSALRDISWLRTLSVYEGAIHGYQSYVCLFEPENINNTTVEKISKQRNKFMQYLHEAGISTRPGTHAIHDTKYYKEKYGIKSEDFFNSFAAEKCSIAFPLYDSMQDEEFNFVINNISEYSKQLDLMK